MLFATKSTMNTILRFLSWEEKDSKLTGYRVSNASDVYSVDNYDRNDTAMNIFATEAQAIASISIFLSPLIPFSFFLFLFIFSS
jgi:hypothetical protein